MHQMRQPVDKARQANTANSWLEQQYPPSQQKKWYLHLGLFSFAAFILSILNVHYLGRYSWESSCWRLLNLRKTLECSLGWLIHWPATSFSALMTNAIIVLLVTILTPYAMYRMRVNRFSWLKKNGFDPEEAGKHL